ncbi:MAG TPA: IS110 family transposase [Magnetospirillaceae bacterium]|nr:IS110 family transposase [Magnetospirillaceae bacterium]
MLIAGIDWADDHHDICVLQLGGGEPVSFRVAHSAQGLGELRRKLLAMASRAELVACIVETRHGLLVTALLEAGFKVYPVNPKTVDRRRRPSGAKTDAIDAAILARHGLRELDQLRPLEPDSPIIQELKMLTRDQVGLIEQRTRLVNQLTACLKTYYPSALQFFCKLQQPVALAFLRAYPTLESVRAAEPAAIAVLLKQHRHPRPNETMRRIVTRAHAPELEADPITTRTKARLMLALIAQLASLVDAIRAYDEEIEELFTAHSDREIFQSLPGAGKALRRDSWQNGAKTAAGTCPMRA